MARNFGRRGQMWIAVTIFIAMFSTVIYFLPGITPRLWWQIVIASAITTSLCIVVFDLWIRRDTARRESTIQLLNRITSGDLSVSGREILRATHSARMAAALRALASNLERTIRRFAQLSQDVTRVTEQLSSRSRVLARSATDQLQSTVSAAASVNQIDTSINAMRRSMQELSSNAEETSTSILEMSASIEEVTRIADTLSEFVDQTATAFEEMSASITEVAANTENFSSFATETASSIVEMNATTSEIGRSARESSQLAGYVRDATSEGRSAVEGTVDGMRKIQQAVDEAKIALGELAARSQEIGDIIRVIDEIAGQTNLLALNAAIIAAQAGERGKGFAVVADEIRDLSERTSVSTDEIRTLIENVQRSVERAAEQMNISADRVSDGVSLTARASLVLDKIRDLTDRSTSSIQEIARATEEQTRGSAATTAAIEEVTKMVQQTASATQQQSQTARKVGEQATMVRDTTRHLKRAMTEQAHGSVSISKAMQNISGLVQSVLEATSVLAAESAAIVKSMDMVQRGSEESSFGVSDLARMSNALTHESSLLNQELSRFSLPLPREGGRITTALLLWQTLTVDPIHATAAVLGFLAKSIHAKLVAFGEGAELMPELAESWETLDQGRRYRFHLRRNVRFHNGRLFEARDVYESFLRLLLPASRTSSNWILRSVRGAEEVINGRSRELKGVVVVDQHTVDIQLDEPLAFFISLLSMHECSIVPVEEAGDPERFRLRAPGAGPFRVVEAVEGRHVQLERNRDYFVVGRPLVDELRFRLDLTSGREVAEAFLRGELDVAHGIPLGIVNDLKNDARLAPYLLTSIQLHTSYLGFDNSTAPFNRAEVRQAVSHAVDRQRINEQVFANLGAIASGLLPPGLLGYDASLRGTQHDPDRSRSLLKQAGLENGFTLQYRTWDTDEFNNTGIVPLIIEDLAQIGIRVNVTRHPASDARSPLARPGHGNLFLGNWYADFPDPDNFFFIFFHSLSTSIPGLYFHSAEVDRKIEHARRTNDIEGRASTYRELDAMVVRDAPVVPLFHERLFVLHRPNVRGVRTSLVPPPVRYQEIWVEEE
ncbi:MAG TPA: ABC transporter substrate-binding protein [Thermoanaerobaculia bacterium]|nr:ABC transporter substrate-binding protein [Thermoanaerobaculia bacterium]